MIVEEIKMGSTEDSTWNEISSSSYNFEHAMNKSHRKQTGSYYTSLNLTMPMLSELFNKLSEDQLRNIHELRFLEPCVGTDNFVFTWMQAKKKYLETVLSMKRVWDSSKFEDSDIHDLIFKDSNDE